MAESKEQREGDAPSESREKKAKAPAVSAIRLLAGKVIRRGPVYGQPGDVVQVPAECDADRAKALVKAGFAEPA